MVGFNLDFYSFQAGFTSIYIPLWSDSIVLLNAFIVNSFFIYIPLWSDSILIVLGVSQRDNIFTFHYGRIQSVAEVFLSNVAVVFTFHYGRIQSWPTAWMNTLQSYLHSIMVGFNPSRRRESLSGKSHLHSIMVGFNQDGDENSAPPVDIYIPLWSDSIPNSIAPFQSPLMIYIPLWSDSIELRSLFRPMRHKFTFHYGRIQSLSLLRLFR